MNDQQTPDSTPATTEKASDTPAPLTLPDLLKFLEPYMPLLTQITEAVGAQQARTTFLTTLLLAGIVLSLVVLAGLALWLDHVDTAEKIVIALVSFLGGTAMFGGGTKK